ncbi:MAG: acyl carrier protein [Myxococcota bacterium]|jgi:acyl carrier protein
MSNTETAARINAVLIDEFELAAESLIPQATLFDALGLDSLDAVDLIASLEGVFEIRIAEEEAKKVRTVADLYALVDAA